MSKFTDLKATKILKQLAQFPYDLSREGSLTLERLHKFQSESAGYKLFYATERISDEVMEVLYKLSKECDVVEKMKRMQAGEVINKIEGFPSEERSVLHTATRDFFENPNPAEVAKKAAVQAKRECDKLKSFLVDLDKKNRFTDMITIGIGGSDLGPKANYLALQNLAHRKRKVHFISNIDPDDIAQTVQGVDLVKTLVVIVSKSGSTLETLTNEAIMRDLYKKAGLRSEEHFIAITGEGSPLDDPKQYLASFYIWDWIGGRYSSTSMVGGVLLSFAYGFDVYWEFLHGAHVMDKAVLQGELHNNISLIAALLGVWNRTFLHYPTLAVIPYSQALIRFPAHIQQLDMESNGKRIDRQGLPVSYETGPIIWGEPGTNAQHSFFQLIHQGTTVVPVEFVGFQLSEWGQDLKVNGTTSQEKLLSNLFAQSVALATGQKNDNPNKVFPGNRPSHIILGKQLTPFTLGALLAFFEHKVAFQGFIWNINSFDQEGVQLGKVLANQFIARFAERSSKKSETSFPIADFYINQTKTS